MTVSAGAANVFGWFQTLTTITSIITWVSILVAYLRFYYACKAQGVDRNTLPMKAWGQPYVAYIALFFFSVVLFFNGFPVFTKGNWSASLPPHFDCHAMLISLQAQNFCTGYLPIFIFIFFYGAWKLLWRKPFIKAAEVSLSPWKILL
jgi:amino acid transporter